MFRAALAFHLSVFARRVSRTAIVLLAGLFTALAAPLSSTLAVAGRAGRLDDRALALAPRTGTDVDHLAQHRLADVADLAAAVALGA